MYIHRFHGSGNFLITNDLQLPRGPRELIARELSFSFALNDLQLPTASTGERGSWERELIRELNAFTDDSFAASSGD